MSCQEFEKDRLLAAAQNTTYTAFENIFGSTLEPGKPHFTLDIGIRAYSMLPGELKDSFLTVEMLEISDSGLMHMYGGNPDQENALTWIFEVGKLTSQKHSYELLKTIYEKALSDESYFIPQVATWLWPDECREIENERPWSVKRFLAWNPVYTTKMAGR